MKKALATFVFSALALSPLVSTSSASAEGYYGYGSNSYYGGYSKYRKHYNSYRYNNYRYDSYHGRDWRYN